ncbi:MAG: hypothetical protein ABEK16_03690 [Candidatus Nanohalobium sp.]
MLKKGMSFPFSHTAKLVLAVMGLVIGYQVISGIHAQTLGPGTDKLSNALDSLGPQTVIIGGDIGSDNSQFTVNQNFRDDDAEAQMRGLIAFNMMAAVNCNTIKAMDKIFRKPKKSAGLIAHFGNTGNNKKADASNRNPINALVNRTNFNPTCIGAKAIDVNPIDDTLQNLNPLSPDVSETSNDMEGRYGREYFKINTTFSIGDFKPCPADRYKAENCPEVLMGIRLEGEVMPKDEEPPAFWRGFTNAVFVPKGGKPGKWWTGLMDDRIFNQKDAELYADELVLFECDASKIKKAEWKGPILDYGNLAKQILDAELAGLEFAESLVLGKSCNTGNPANPALAESKNLHDTHFKNGKLEGLYNYRVRMVNVPMIAPATPQYTTSGYETKKNKHDSLGEGKFEDFIEEVEYKFCKGARGYVQTNAKWLPNTGEATGSISRIENAVFPMIAITNNKFGKNGNCIRTGSDESLGGFFGFEAPKGRTCSPREARMNKTISPESLSSKLECSFKITRVGFKKFKESRKIEVFRPGWFLKESGSGQCQPSQRDVLDDAVKSGNVEYRDSKLFVTSQGSPSSAKWSVSGAVDKFKLRYTYRTTDYPRVPSSIILKVNGKKKSQIYVNYDKLNAERSYTATYPGGDLDFNPADIGAGKVGDFGYVLDLSGDQARLAFVFAGSKYASQSIGIKSGNVNSISLRSDSDKGGLSIAKVRTAQKKIIPACAY